MKLQGKTLVLVFTLALAVRLLTLMVYLVKMKPHVDLDSYRSLAQHLTAGSGFVAVADSAQELPNVSRTPVYPLFLAALIRIGGDRLGLFLAVQCVLGAAVCVLTMLLASRWLSARWAVIAALLVALDPNSVVRCVDLRTETLFTLLLVGGTCALAHGDKQRWNWALGGFLWSLAALCRPIAVWLWVVAVVLILVRKRRVVYLLLFLVGYLPLVGIWAARNVALTGHKFVSTISTYNLLMYRAAGVEAARTGQKLEAIQHRFLAEFGDIQFFENRAAFDLKLRNYKRTAAHVLFSAPALVARQAVVGWRNVLFGPGARSIHNMLREPGNPARWWPPLYTLVLIVTVALSFVGAIKFGREAVLVWAVALYFVVLSGGPESNSRFRTPITPMLAVLAVAGASTQKEIA